MKSRALTIVILTLVAQAIPTHSAVTPLERTDAGGVARHQAINERVKQGNVDLIFIGDSITQGWLAPNVGKETWDRYHGHRNAVNMGIGGDRTQNVLWRLDHGNIDGIKPKVAVVMLGVNNTGANSAQEIADGLAAIVRKLREKLPETKVLLLAPFPASERPDARREKLAQAASLIAPLHDGRYVHFLDIGPQLMNPDQVIYKDVMYDFVHLTRKGYEIWAASIETKLKELLGEK